VSPVAVGTGSAHSLGAADPGLAVLALVVALALQVGVNYANDYSDGIRGTDADRVGPPRLVGGGLAAPGTVRLAAFLCFGVSALAGLALVALSGAVVLLLVGAVAILAAWRYTGGSNPYGYRGLGEVAVFVFFGLVAVVGTTWSQAQALDAATWAGATGVGLLACAILVANNLRDIPGDRAVGERRTRLLYVALLGGAFVAAVLAAVAHPWALLALIAAPLAVPPVRRVLAAARGHDLIVVLAATGLTQLAYGLLLALGLAITG
jgi:1,4-dihydroxy-2-naphthoate octaprenyltransferase